MITGILGTLYVVGVVYTFFQTFMASATKNFEGFILSSLMSIFWPITWPLALLMLMIG